MFWTLRLFNSLNLHNLLDYDISHKSPIQKNRFRFNFEEFPLSKDLNYIFHIT